MDIAVIVSAEKSGCIKINSGTRINPPPAPINVPIVPIANPIRINK
jgi:hypothetical protein